jgi:tetratricopeptide (TPR) repeat protein
MHRELGENEQAVEKLNSAVQINQNFSLAYSLLGEIYREMNNLEKSAAAYENATNLNPWSFKDYFSLGRVYEMMQNFAKAVKAYVRACELKPEHFEANAGAARSYYQIKDYVGALEYGQRAQKIDPNFAEIQTLLGNVYKSRKDYSEAIKAYKRSLEIDSDDPDVMISLAAAYLNSGRNEPARELLTSVIQMQPDNGLAYQYLGACYIQLRDQAIKSHKKTGRDNTDNSEIEAQLAECVAKSIESYKKAIEINDTDWVAHRGLGVAYMLDALEKKDDELKKQAIAQWQLSLEINPEQDRAKSLRKLIRKYSK